MSQHNTHHRRNASWPHLATRAVARSKMWGGHTWRARAGAEPPARSRCRAPGQRVRGLATWSWKSFSFCMLNENSKFASFSNSLNHRYLCYICQKYWRYNSLLSSPAASSRVIEIYVRKRLASQAPNLTDPLPSHSKNSPDLHQSQEQPLAKWRSPCAPLLRQLHSLPVQQRVTFKLSCLVHQSLSGHAPAH